MLTGKIRREPATKADLVQIMGRAPDQTVRAWVWRRDDEPIAAAGWYMAGTRAVVFSDIRKGTEMPKKMTIWREAASFMADLKLPALCVATSGSEPFLRRLGWSRAYTGPDGEVFRCN